jgi:plasmid stabilization system protein ParE
MKRELRYRPEFEGDVVEASAWYEARQPGLGKQFEQEVSLTLRRIAERPMSIPEVAKGIRRTRLNVFPYLVVYRVHSDFIEVGGVVHGARHPSVQRKRFRRR